MRLFGRSNSNRRRSSSNRKQSVSYEDDVFTTNTDARKSSIRSTNTNKARAHSTDEDQSRARNRFIGQDEDQSRGIIQDVDQSRHRKHGSRRVHEWMECIEHEEDEQLEQQLLLDHEFEEHEGILQLGKGKC